MNEAPPETRRPLQPPEIYARVVEEGRHRLGTTLPQTIARALTAGFTIVFGIAALGIVHSLVGARFGAEVGDLAGSIAFGIGLVFLIVGRSDLFTENFLDPVAAAVEDGGRAWLLLARLWPLTLLMNLVGGTILVLILSIDGVMPDDGSTPLTKVAEEILALGHLAAFGRAIAAGALLTLMTWMLQSAATTGARIAIAWIVGAFVAIGPFNHVVVTVLHLVFGDAYGVQVRAGQYLEIGLVATAGNFLGGIVFVTLTHLVQARGGADMSADLGDP